MEEIVPRCRTGKTQMRNNPEERVKILELMTTGPAVILFLFLTCIDKRTKGCDRGSDVGTVHSELGEERQVSLKRLRKTEKERIVRDSVSR